MAVVKAEGLGIVVCQPKDWEWTRKTKRIRGTRKIGRLLKRLIYYSLLPAPYSLFPSLYLPRNSLDNRTDFGTVKNPWITCPVKVANL